MAFDLKMENGDILISNDFELVRGTAKLIQDAAKTVLTPKGSNITHPSWGTSINNSVIGRALNIDETEIASEISEALTQLANLMMNQARITRTAPSELIANIEDIQVARDIQDPRQYNISITLLSQDLEPISFPLRLTV